MNPKLRTLFPEWHFDLEFKKIGTFLPKFLFPGYFLETFVLCDLYCNGYCCDLLSFGGVNSLLKYLSLFFYSIEFKLFLAPRQVGP